MYEWEGYGGCGGFLCRWQGMWRRVPFVVIREMEVPSGLGSNGGYQPVMKVEATDTEVCSGGWLDIDSLIDMTAYIDVKEINSFGEMHIMKSQKKSINHDTP